MATVESARKYNIFFCVNHEISFKSDSPWQITENRDEADVFVISRSMPSWMIDLAEHDPTIVRIFVAQSAFPHEFQISDLKQWHFEEMLENIRPILDNKYKLPENVLKAIKEDPMIATLAFLWTRGKNIDPIMHSSLKKGYSYPVPFTEHDIEAILMNLYDLSLLDRKFYDVAHPCTKCGSVQILYRDACIECHSTDITEHTMIHHFPCSYHGAETEFLDIHGNYVCPKCQKMLNQIGLDYDKPGTINICNACGYESQDSRVMGRCLSCSNEINAIDAPRKAIYSYHLNEMGVEALFQNSIHRYDPRKALGESLDIVDDYMFYFLSQKLRYIAERYKFETTLLEIGTKDSAKNIGEYDKITLMSSIGKEFAHLLRHTDTVSFINKRLFILLPGTTVEQTNVVVQKATQQINNTVAPELQGAFEMKYESILATKSEKEHV
ncbi:MAG: hypothetical protein ACE365_03395 [Gammaproteobacteria bacterium]